MQYRLALDLGTNSIGWAVFRLHQGENDEHPQPVELIRLGSRVFSNNDSQIGAGRHPKSGDSLAQGRREPRSQRRRRDRYLLRRKDLLEALIELGLMPRDKTARKALQKLNPYELRARALDEAIPPHHLGRVLFHLNQRRGFKSNRKTDGGDAESGKIRQAITTFEEAMGDARTVGEALHRRLQQGEGARARLRGSGAKAYYDFYIAREMIEHEFDELWRAQQIHHPMLLTEQARQLLDNIIFRQRKLKTPPVGKCTLLPDEPRAPKALPSAQQFRLYQEINHLRLLRLDPESGETDNNEFPLSREQRDQLAAWLERRSIGKYEQMRKQLFGRADAENYLFTIEASTLGRTNVHGNRTTYALKNNKAFGNAWHKLDLAEQDRIVKQLLDVEEECELVQWLIEEFDFDDERARYIANAKLEDGHLRFSQQAIDRVLEQLKDGWQTDENQPAGQPLTYDKAVIAAGFDDHRITKPDQLLERLPPYNEVLLRYCQQVASSSPENLEERITNPTVHIALNQLRRLVNAVIGKYGAPAEIHIELARELKKSRAAKIEDAKRNRTNRERNATLNDKLATTYHGQKQNAENRLRLRLFEELKPLNHYCVISGDSIDPSKLFSNAYQIDHILPFSKTLDDGYSNKILVTRQANADKGNLSIWELCQHPNYDWEQIQHRAASLPYNKRKRFSQNAIEDWLGRSGEFKNDGAGFLQRQLTDTAYLSRVAREYLQTVCDGDKIVTSPGRLTALLRGKWGLNRLLSDHNGKNRDDHRHHAIDAAVIGLIDRSLLKAVADRAKRMEVIEESSLFKGIDEELPDGFRQQLERLIERCIVSHKPDHNPKAQLHEATAYGIVEQIDEDRYLARYRKPLSELSRKNLDSLQDTRLAERLKHITEGLGDAELKEKLAKLAHQDNWPRKAYVTRTISGVAVKLTGTALSPDPSRRPPQPAKLYKGGGNYCYEIYRTDKGTWDGEIITTFEANQAPYQAFMRDRQGFETTSFSGKPLVMRLINNDVIVIEPKPGGRRVMRVQKMSEGTIALCDHFEGNVDSRDRNKQDPFSYLRKSPGALRALNARRVRVDMLGRVLVLVQA